MLKNPLYGDQTPNNFETKIYIYYNTCVKNHASKNPLMLTSFKTIAVPINNLKAYASIADIINDRDLLPENKDSYAIEVLKRYIMLDGAPEMGIEYPEYSVIAYSGNSVFDRPIAAITFDKNKSTEYVRYYPTPDFGKLVKRL